MITNTLASQLRARDRLTLIHHFILSGYLIILADTSIMLIAFITFDVQLLQLWQTSQSKCECGNIFSIELEA
jgi:hypothetical protein